MRDPLAPVINGFDLSGIVNRYSFQCDQFYTEGDNGGTLLDGSTVTDVLAAKVRLSWTLNSLSTAQYAALNAALNAGTSPDTVNAYVFDPTIDDLRLARFHVTRPPFNFAFDMNAGKMMSYAGGEIVLEEASPVARFAVTPPTNTAYFVGEPLDLSGFSVTSYDNDGNATDITAQCTTIPANGTVFQESGPVTVSVSWPGTPSPSYTFDVTVTAAEIIASGDWWTLFKNGRLSVFCVGDIPDYSGVSGNVAPWRDYRQRDITSICIFSSVTGIGTYAFYYCLKLTSAIIPGSVSRIGNCAFYYCRNLASVTIPGSVISIGTSAFYQCSGLTNAIISNGVTSIGDSAFDGCSSLESVIIPDSVTSIGESAFYNCASLSNVTIPDGVTSIGMDAFYDCSSLERITIPGSAVNLGTSAFGGCTNLISATIRHGPTDIPISAFWGCSRLASVMIPDSVTIIYGRAFEGCTSLTDIYYEGSQAQWNQINIETLGNEPLASATIHYNSTGPT